MKICTKCNIKKNKSLFYSSKYSKDNLDNYCKECRKNHSKIQYAKRIDKIKKTHANWLKNGGREKRAKYYYEYQKNRLKNDSLFRFQRNLRSLIKNKIKAKSARKNSKSLLILGADFKFVIDYLEKKFQNGMTWENYGLWHIDHIVPMASAKTEEEVLKLSHYTNLQPLWASDNIKKGSKINLTQDNFC